MTRDEFLARCENAWDCGLVNADNAQLLNEAIDFVMRLEGGQIKYAIDFLDRETRRQGFGRLASDAELYRLMQFAAILSHPCQECAVDPHAWWTRRSFCEHRDQPTG